MLGIDRHGSSWLLKPGPKRSFFLLAIGAGAGLMLAGYGLFRAPASSRHSLPLGAAAMVNQRQILVTDFRAQVESTFNVGFANATADQRKNVLESMIAEELLVQRGLEIDLPSRDPYVRQILVSGVTLQIDLELSGQTPSDDQLRAYFSAHRDKYVDPAAMRLQHVVVLLDAQHSAKQALDIAQQMAEALRKKGAPSATFVKFGAKEIDGTAAAVIPDSVVKAALGAKLYEVASGLGSGDVSAPVPLTDGIHVLLMLQRQPSRALEFDQARSVVDKDFKREAREQAQREYVSVLRKKAEIEVDRAQLQ